MKWWIARKKTEIISAVITGVITLSFLFILRICSNINQKEKITLEGILPAREIPLREHGFALAHDTSTGESTPEETIASNSPEKDNNDKIQVNYYIIIGSFGDLVQAQQKAGKLKNDHKADIIVLPPTKEGNYRISYGKYSSLEEAKTMINSVRATIKPDAWIFSVKK